MSGGVTYTDDAVRRYRAAPEVTGIDALTAALADDAELVWPLSASANCVP